jgi:hypothetical protein
MHVRRAAGPHGLVVVVVVVSALVCAAAAAVTAHSPTGATAYRLLQADVAGHKIGSRTYSADGVSVVRGTSRAQRQSCCCRPPPRSDGHGPHPPPPVAPVPWRAAPGSAQPAGEGHTLWRHHGAAHQQHGP